MHQVAQIILEQFGGRRFAVMTGAKDFVGSANALSFRIPRAKDGINAVRVELTAFDDYTVTYSKIRGVNVTEVAKVEGVYADNLRESFTHRTGLHTSL